MEHLGHTTVAVLGGGLTGLGTALELAKHGTKVALVEQDNLPMNRASLRNEGKIHLGFIYANDRTFATARLQLQGALHFRALLTRWIGTRANALRRSTPFVYLVTAGSLLAREELEVHYAAVERECADHLSQAQDLDYLGDRPKQLFHPCALSNLKPLLKIDGLAAAFRTEERAIDTDELAQALRAAVRDATEIRLLARRKVESVTRHCERFQIEGSGPEGRWQLDAAQVVNATWENRLAIDETVGLRHEAGWLHRLKYRVIARVPERLRQGPSVTMVLGPYGDVVIRPDGTAYLSWYPVGMRGWTLELAPPASWGAPCRGELADEERRSVADGLLGAIDEWYPGIGASQPLLVDAGAIVAYGRTDVDDAASGLHDRSRVGVTSSDGYHSVDPGKLTTAPLFAKLAADRVLHHG
ncbi:MAG: FAD-dependent oxidoreductase [Casimicrobiaceae bacterium]